jgi:hypothetical protein
MDESIPERAQFAERGLASGGMLDILRGATNMPRGNEMTSYLAKIWKEGEAESGDGVRRVRQELGQGDLSIRRVDIPSYWY